METSFVGSARTQRESDGVCCIALAYRDLRGGSAFGGGVGQTVSGRVVGRETELSLLDGFLGSIDDGFAVLALEGEPGIGKTTVWQEGMRRAEARGLLALSCQPAQSEARLSFVGLGDLLGPVPDAALAALPDL